MNMHWLGHRWNQSQHSKRFTPCSRRGRSRLMGSLLLRGSEALEERRLLALSVPSAPELSFEAPAVAVTSSDQPDWIGGSFAVIYPPYVGSSQIVDAQLGDGDYTSRDVDLFAFDVLTWSTFTFESASVPGQAPTDTQFRLFNSAGEELMYDDDNGAEPGCSRLESGWLQGGRYYLGVSGYNNRYYNPTTPGTGAIGQTGPYRLIFSVNVSVDAPGNTMATAVDVGHDIGESELVTVNQFIGGLGEMGADDVDMFTFTAFLGTQFYFQTGAWGSYFTPDTYLRLFDDDGTVLAFDDDGGVGTFSQIDDFVAPYTGRYYLGVSGYPNTTYDPSTGAGRTPGAVGDYVLHSFFGEWPDAGDTRDSSQFVNQDFSLTDKLGNQLGEGAADVDLVKWYALAGDEVHALTRPTMDPGARDVDTVLRLFDAAGNQVAYNDDAAGTYSELYYEFPEAGVYYLGASGFPNTAYDITNPAVTMNRLLGDYGDYDLVVDFTFTETAEITSPHVGDVVAGWVDVLGTASSASLDRWELRAGPTPSIYPELIAQGNANVFNSEFGSWNTGAVVDGNYYLELTVTDIQGNQAITQVGPVLVDNTAPVAVISSPVENGTIATTVTISGTAVDANIDSWVLAYSLLPDGPWVNLAFGTTNVFNGTLGVWDTRSLPNGTYYLWLAVSDRAGSVREDIQPVQVANQKVISAINLDARSVVNFDALGNGTLFANAADGLKTPIGGVYDAQGNLYVADVIAGPAASGSIIKFNTAGAGSTFADVFDGVIAPTGVTIDAAGNLYVAAYLTNQIIKITPAGMGSVFADAADGVNRPFDVAFDGTTGNVFVANLDSRQVLKITPAGVASVFADSGDGLFSPIGVAVDFAGYVYVSDVLRGRVTKFTPAGVGTVFASPAQGLTTPTGMAFDAVGNLYVANYLSDTITKITPTGVGSLFADASDGLSRTFDVAFGIVPLNPPPPAPIRRTQVATPSATSTTISAAARSADAVLSGVQMNWLVLRWLDSLNEDN